jgi:hypothetical protein
MLSVFIIGDYGSDALDVYVKGNVFLDIGELPQ